ncbi:hypothetical protein GBAR_LOCUS12560, partial [Geodia barretti]
MGELPLFSGVSTFRQVPAQNTDRQTQRPHHFRHTTYVQKVNVDVYNMQAKRHMIYHSNSKQSEVSQQMRQRNRDITATVCRQRYHSR